MTNEEELTDDQINFDQVTVVEKRSLVVAYLSYALEDVRAFSPTSLYLLQLAINTLQQDETSSHTVQ